MAETTSDVKIYSFDEVAVHNKVDDLWLIIDGKVYDVTKFADEHPGGVEVMQASAAKDGTQDFEDIGHSRTAREMLTEYYIGDIDPSTIKELPPATQLARKSADPYAGLKLVLQFLLPVVLVLLALAVRAYTAPQPTS